MAQFPIQPTCAVVVLDKSQGILHSENFNYSLNVTSATNAREFFSFLNQGLAVVLY